MTRVMPRPFSEMSTSSLATNLTIRPTMRRNTRVREPETMTTVEVASLTRHFLV